MPVCSAPSASSPGARGGVDQALGETRKPALFNVLTTGAGLLGLLLVPIPPIQVFGFFGALGTLAVFLTVYWLVPPFLRHWDWPPLAANIRPWAGWASWLSA
ncbi:MAG: hypothetical protein IPO59_14565 [Betaproteobacteria bacterium]|nr:hypothetical protein [Betaproteobacteria bacterium]